VADRLLRRPDKIVAGRHAFDANAGRRDEREAGDAARVAHRGLGRGPAAERMADDVDRRREACVEHVEIIHRQIRHLAKPMRIVGAAEARMLRNSHREVVREAFEEWQPGRPAAGAVQEQDRLAFAGAAHTNARAAGDQCLYFGCHDRGQSQPCSLPSMTANLRPAVSGKNSANNRLKTAPTMPNIMALKRLPSAAITGTRYG